MLCIAQGTLLNTLMTSRGEKFKKKKKKRERESEWICVYVKLIHSAVQQKATQHCKSTLLKYN